MTDLIINRFKSSLLDSNMYIIEYSNKSFIIDPWESIGALKYLEDNAIEVDFIILTHEHYDHISGVNWLVNKFDCRVICNDECEISIRHPNLNFSKYFDILTDILPFGKNTQNLGIKPYCCSADITFKDKKIIIWYEHNIELVSTPGHSKGSICILIDNKYLFSGDSLLRDYSVITRLKGGNYSEYKRKTVNFLKSIPTDILVFPGHYESFYLGTKIKDI